MKLIVAARAGRELREIAIYTARTFGLAQAEAYITALERRFAAILAHPLLGQVRDDLRPRLRSLREGRHLIFDRVTDDRVEIIGLPHASMDIDAYFDEEEGEA